MGTPGARATGAAARAAAHFTNGLFADGVMFGVVTSNGALALKADDAIEESG